MVSIGKLQTTKGGHRYWPIQVSMGKGRAEVRAHHWQSHKLHQHDLVRE